MRAMATAGGGGARLAAVAAMVIMSLACVSAESDRELQVLAKALAAKKAAVHHLSSTLQNKIRPEPHASAARTAASHKALHAAVHSSPLHVTAQALNEAPATKKEAQKAAGGEAKEGGAEGSADELLKESIDDNQVGDFSKDGNKHDHRMMKGKFDWLLKASSPLYTAAKVVANTAEHQVVKVLHKGTTPKGSALQESSDANATAADGAGDEDAAAAAGDDLEDVKKQNAKDETKFLEFSQDKEVYFFGTWIVVLVVVLGVLGLCVLYARQCLGAPEGRAPAGGKPGAFSGGGYGTGGGR